MKSKTLTKYGRELIIFENGDIFRGEFIDKNGKKWPLKKLKQTGERPLIGLTVDNVFHPLRADKLVAEAYLPYYDYDFEVYHEDGDRKNNAPKNLRVIPKSASRKIRSKDVDKNYSGFKGVTWCKRQRRWVVQCWLDGKNNYIGQYEDELEAAEAYNKFGKKNGFLKEALNKI